MVRLTDELAEMIPGVYQASQLDEQGRRILVEWAASKGFDPGQVYRITLHGVTGTVYRYALDAAGCKYLDGDDIAVLPPEVIVI